MQFEFYGKLIRPKGDGWEACVKIKGEWVTFVELTTEQVEAIKQVRDKHVVPQLLQ